MVIETRVGRHRPVFALAVARNRNEQRAPMLGLRADVFGDLEAIHADEEIHAFRLGNVAERSLDVAVQVLEQQIVRVERDGPRLDLRQIQDVVDQCQQVVARRMK